MNAFKPLTKAAAGLLLVILSCSAPPPKSNPFPFEEITVAALEQGYKSGTYTIHHVVQSFLDRIDAIDRNGPKLNSIIVVNPDALAIADSLDQILKDGKAAGPLFGVPVIIKDNIDTHDKMSTTAGSRALLNSHPLHDSFVAHQLRKAGAIIIAKSNLSEWANFRASYSSSGWSGVGGQTKNPYVLDRNPCGSSAGSGAAEAANLCVVAIGTETNGSIVCPSNNNGLVGIKPTVGLISRSGIVPISFTQDTSGPMCRTVSDAAITLGALTGVDSLDSKTLASDGHSLTNYTTYLKADGLKGKRIGLWSESGTMPSVDTLMSNAVAFMRSQGAEVIPIKDIEPGNVENESFTVMLYEFKDGLNNYFKTLGTNAPIKSVSDLIAFDKSDSVELKYFDQKLLEQANAKGDLNSPEYKKALEDMLKALRGRIDHVMDSLKLDAIVAPTGGPAWTTDILNGDRFLLGSSSPAAISGYPSITVPMGFIDELPVDLSFFGRAWSEPVLIEIAYGYEQGTKFRRPPHFIPALDE